MLFFYQSSDGQPPRIFRQCDFLIFGGSCEFQPCMNIGSNFLPADEKQFVIGHRLLAGYTFDARKTLPNLPATRLLHFRYLNLKILCIIWNVMCINLFSGLRFQACAINLLIKLMPINFPLQFHRDRLCNLYSFFDPPPLLEKLTTVLRI